MLSLEELRAHSILRQTKDKTFFPRVFFYSFSFCEHALLFPLFIHSENIYFNKNELGVSKLVKQFIYHFSPRKNPICFSFTFAIIVLINYCIDKKFLAHTIGNPF